MTRPSGGSQPQRAVRVVNGKGRKMRDFLNGVRFKILVAILTVMVGFMVAAIYSGGTAQLFSRLISAVTVPFQQVSANISGGVSNFFDKYLNAARTYEENRLLREEIGELRSQLVDYEKIKHEYEQLKEIGDMREQRSDLIFATASVIGRDYSNNFHSFTVDKGSLDDISLYDPVITADGSLVGYVNEVSLTSSKVMTLLNVGMNIGASNISTRDIGNVTGTVELAERERCLMEYLPRESETKEGDIIVTSGSSLFPKEIVIGAVEQTGASSRGNSIEAVIRPAADIRGVKDVFIITHFEGQGAD